MGRIKDGLLPLLLRWRAASTNMRPLYRVFAETLAQSSQKTIELGGRPQKYKPLRPATLLARAGGGHRAFTKRARKKGNLSFSGMTKRARKIVSGAKPLIDKSTMLRRMSSEATDRSAVWGNNAVQARLLNSGGWAGRGHAVFVVARKFIQKEQPFREDREAMEKATLEHFGVSN